MKPLADQAARDAIRRDLDATLVVEAAAGTGKTTELVQRILSLLRSGKARLPGIVAVTFTERAAGEMKLRLRGEIERARGEGGITADERARLDAALADLEAAHIGTIHGFCADLLRERPVEAKVDPLFEVCAEDAKERLYAESFERWFQDALADPPEGVRRVLRRRSRDRDATGPREVLRKAGETRIEQRDFTAPWRRDPFDREVAVDGLIVRLRALGDLAARGAPSDYLAKNLAEIHRFLAEQDAREAVRGRDHDGLEADLRELKKHWTWGYSGRGTLYARGMPRAPIVAQRDATKAELDKVLERADADLAACLFADTAPLVARYEALKSRAGKLDFLDLLVVTRDLLGGDEAVRRELQARFTHLLVDEFQDTDPLQAEILLLLAADDPAVSDARAARPVPGKLFVVGDPKQSIYRFRRADVALYEAIKRRLLLHGAKLVHLATSFRSAPAIQRAVNAAFAPRMQGNPSGTQAEYVALEPSRAERRGQPSIVALPVPRPYGDYRKVTAFRVEESLPDAVGAFVDFLVNESGWTITERERGAPTPIEPRHICLLFKRLQSFGRDVTRSYVDALEARRIRHVLVGGRSLYAREEVIALTNALAAIEWPDDELSVFATLRGPFLALGDDALLAFRHEHGSLHSLRTFEAGSALTVPVADALSILRELHLARNRRPIADTINRLLEATRAHAGIAIWPTGEQALANVQRILDFARRFEAGGPTSFRAFVRRLEEDAARGGAADAPIVEEGSDGVRIMTVHKAKGLEFPVVILVDPTAPAVMREPSRYVDVASRLFAFPLAGCTPSELLEHRDAVLEQDREESVRLAYVAATRARDLLVVPVVGDAAVSGWIDVLHDVVYPKDDARRASLAAPGCPTFGEDSVFEWPSRTPRDVSSSVRPGLHAPRNGEHGVVWWDPAVLRLDKRESVGLRHQRILVADDDEARKAAEPRDEQRANHHDEWRARRAGALARGGEPSLVVRTFTREKDGGEGDARVEVATSDASRTARPHGKRFGTLVHNVLANVDLAARDADVEAIAALQGRIAGATTEEVLAAVVAAVAALRHPLLERARAAGASCRREAPVVLRLEDGSIVEGTLDVAFRETEGGVPVWTVVDFKTDVELGSRRAAYETQVALYARAVEAATGERARAVLLSV